MWRWRNTILSYQCRADQPWPETHENGKLYSYRNIKARNRAYITKNTGEAFSVRSEYVREREVIVRVCRDCSSKMLLEMTGSPLNHRAIKTIYLHLWDSFSSFKNCHGAGMYETLASNNHKQINILML